MPPKTIDKSHWRCSQCGRSGPEVIGKRRIQTGSWHGENLAHERLCQGRDPEDRPLGLPPVCPACRKRLARDGEPTAAVWEGHWKTCQPRYRLSDSFTLRHIRAIFEKHQLPTTNMNADFGNILTRQATLVDDRELSKLARKWEMDPLAAITEAKTSLVRYRTEFSSFFNGAVPLTFHSHVSDVSPQVIGSTVRSLIKTSPVRLSTGFNGFLSEKQVYTCGVAVLAGSYGAGCGPLVASGPEPEILRLKDIVSVTSACKSLSILKAKGVIGVAVEMVSSSNGRPLKPDEWANLAKACHSLGLYLIVDEAQTAIRCGAPFAHQLPDYADHVPSFVIFGKGLRTSGLATCVNGVTVSHLGYNQLNLGPMLELIDARYSEVINSHGSFRKLAPAAERIGSNLRQVLKDVQQRLGHKKHVRGCAAFIFLNRNEAAELCTEAASAGKSTMRWLPFLDAGLEDYQSVSSLFGASAASLRENLINILSEEPTACVNCGESLKGPEDKQWKRCKTCSKAFCLSCKEEGWGMIPFHESGQCLERMQPCNSSCCKDVRRLPKVRS
ncbi:unnamed protein product [Colletotrichum noveboracense]|uniref:Aminotransferase class-III n=1 Tax=Colletotrichum noveboracense TaxID=2664923 RepID=A0A9W4S8P5_9PEZI|nr:unnamed protein product [Colletotrichum noveboracense]